jgi:hypothetical protein
VRFSDIQGDNVGKRGIFFRQDKPGNALTIRRNDAIRAGNRQKIVQRSLRIRNPGREAGLIQPVQGGEVVRLVRP